MKDIENQISAYLDNELSEKERELFEKEVENNISLREELTQMQLLRQKMTDIPVPKFDEQKVKANFYALLEAELSVKTQTTEEKGWLGNLFTTPLPVSSQASTWLNNLLQLFTGKKSLQLAFASVLLLLGVGIGYFLLPSKNYDQQMTQLTNEVQAMKEMMTLTLLEQQSPTERLKAVSMTSELDNVNDKIIVALLQTLDNDENINVRLAAVEALYNFRNNPKAREGLVKSISKQDSPLVQVALVEVIIALQDKKNVPVLQELIKKENLNESVKTKAESGIEALQL
jgi:negative regulator of sigma E activity